MALVTKAIVILLFLCILFALGSALYYLVHGEKEDSDRIVKALTWRIGLSILLFVLLFVAFALGWIHPHPI